MFAGFPSQGSNKGKFVYDTGSGYLVISSNDCKSCNSKYYNPAVSSSAKMGAEGYSTQKLIFGSAHLKGNMYSDRVCVNPGQPHSCADDFGFFLMKE
jgi:hypothetical protein